MKPLDEWWIFTTAGILGFLLIAGCATIFQGTMQEITITSEPETAQVVIRTQDSPNKVESDMGIYHAQAGSPLVLKLTRGNSYRMEVSKEGYQTQVVNIRHEVSVIWWVIDAFTLGIGNLADAISGALFDLKPDRVHVVLEPRPLQEPTAP